jgi:diadenosine tetraphosphate (Ap4A) HIT family hydrolase
MPETPQQFYARAKDALRVPPLGEWDTWPFVGELRPKELEPPAEERRLEGQGAVDCRACTRADSECLWANERWRLTALPEAHGLPVVVLLEPRDHYASPAELPDDLAREQGLVIGMVERAVMSVGGIERVHIGRWGEGAEHLHWWFLARPAGMRQLASSFALVWDDVLPPTPQDVWDENLALVTRSLQEQTSAR